MSSYHKRKKQGQNFIKLALSITEKLFLEKSLEKVWHRRAWQFGIIAVRLLTPRRFFYTVYNIKVIFENTKTFESGFQDGLQNQDKRRSTILWHCAFNSFLLCCVSLYCGCGEYPYFENREESILFNLRRCYILYLILVLPPDYTVFIIQI